MRKTLRLLLAAGFCLLSLAGGRLTALSASAPALAWLETQYSIPMLEGAVDAALSPDGRFLYAASFDDDAVAAFSRDPNSGALIFVEAQVDGSGSVQDLNGVQSVLVSPDGRHVYAAAYADNAVTIFSRDLVSGALSYAGRVKDDEGAITALGGADSLVMDPAGEFLYVASYFDDALAVFDRDPVSGLLVQIDVEQDTVGGALGLLGAEQVLLSPDGKNVYVASSASDAVAVFTRNTTSGLLTWLERKKDGEAGLDGLNGASGLAISPNGLSLYAAGQDDNAIVIFYRNPTSGALTFVSVVKDGVGGVDWLAGAKALALSPAGDLLYLVSRSDSALVSFIRHPATGQLTQASHYTAAGDFQDTFQAPENLALSSDGRHVYVASRSSDSLSLFIADPSGKMSFSQARRNLYTMRGPVGSAVSPSGERLYVTGPNDNSLMVFNVLSSGALTYAWDDQARPGMLGPRDVAVSPVGEFVYLAAHDSDSILRFHWDSAAETLEYQSTYTDGSGTVDGLDGVQAIAISPDGGHLYAASETGSEVAVFGRSIVTGELTWAATYRDGVGGNEYLGGAYDVSVSPDGKHVYVAGYVDGAITVFLRDIDSGLLTRLYAYVNEGFDPPFLDGVNALVVSPDNRFLYSVARQDDALTVFERDPDTGGLTWRSHYLDGIRDVQGLDGARGIAVDPAGGAVYVASQYSHALAYFLRNPADGLLTFVRAYVDDSPGIDGLRTADAVTVSPDGRHIYISGYGDNAVAVFRWDFPIHLPVVSKQ